MFKKLLLILIFTVFVTPLAKASHLGPIVFGEERIEKTFFCRSKQDAMFIARQEERVIAVNKSMGYFINEIKHLVHQNKCGTADIRYTPLETIYQWNGRGVYKGAVKDFFYSIVKSQSGTATIYVFVADKAPPPDSTSFDEERFENVIYCYLEKDAMSLVVQEKDSRAKKESREQYYENVRLLIKDKKCGGGFNGTRYTPLKTVHKGYGLEYIDSLKPNPNNEKSQKSIFYIVRSRSGDSIIFVFTRDKIPLPDSTKK